MVVSPFQQSLVAGFVPEDMRGRYMAVSGLTWSIAFIIGPYFAGLILDSPNPNVLWFVSSFIGLLATISFIVLGKVHQAPLPSVEAKTTEPAGVDQSNQNLSSLKRDKCFCTCPVMF